MANARVKAVYGALADLWSRPRYFHNYLTDLREPVGRGDTIEVPSIGSLTVAQASVSQTAQDVSNQAISPSVLTLTVNQEPAIFVEVQANQDMQVMDGAFFSQVATQATSQLKNSIDSTIVNNTAYVSCWDTAGTYHDNAAGAALTGKMFLNSKAALEDQDGAHNLACFVGAYGLASLLNISAFIPSFTAAESGDLGIPRIGTVYGIPVYQTNSIPKSPAVAVTASSITSNVCTATVAAGHGIVPGSVITTTGLSTNVTAAAVTSVTATTIVYPCTASNGSNGTGTITEQSTWNIMADLAHGYIAQQKLPSVREVPYYNRTSNSLQISALYGYVVRTGRFRVLHSPALSA